MRRNRSRRWTVMMMREGQVRSRTFTVSPGAAFVVSVVVAGTFIATFVVAGRWSRDQAMGARTVALEAEVEGLRRERNEVAAVVGKLDQLEGEYEQLRRVMGGEVAPSRRDVLLPPLAEEDAAARVARSEEGDRQYVWPLVERGFVTRSFGDTTESPFGGHVGVDIAVPAGSYVRSVRAGHVEAIGVDPDYGLYVRLAHEGTVETLYAHNSWLFVAQGDSVETGEVIALSGNSGRSTAPHLHVEIERDGAPIDPLEVLRDES